MLLLILESCVRHLCWGTIQNGRFRKLRPPAVPGDNSKWSVPERQILNCAIWVLERKILD
jgi:hypothetical protein